jgi:hypothetical protein
MAISPYLFIANSSPWFVKICACSPCAAGCPRGYATKPCGPVSPAMYVRSLCFCHAASPRAIACVHTPARTRFPPNLLFFSTRVEQSRAEHAVGQRHWRACPGPGRTSTGTPAPADAARARMSGLRLRPRSSVPVIARRPESS